MSVRREIWVLFGPLFLTATLLSTLIADPSSLTPVGQLAFQLSSALAIFITFLSFQESSHLMAGMKQTHRDGLYQLKKIIQSYQIECAAIHGECKEGDLVRSLIQEALRDSEIRASQLLDQLNDLRVHHFQQMILKEGEAKEDHRYKQLGEQFKEKSQVLNETRRALFLSENERLALQKERTEKSIEESPEQRELLSQLALLEQEHRHLEQMVTSLEEIVTCSLAKNNIPSSLKKLALCKSI